MRAKIRWKQRHSILGVILVVVFVGFIFRDEIITQNKPTELTSVKDKNKNANSNTGINVKDFAKDFQKYFAAHCSGPYPVKKVYFQDEKVMFQVSVAGKVREFELFGAKLPKNTELRNKALQFITEYVKQRPVYLEVEKEDGKRFPDDETTNLRHIFVQNPENNFDSRYEWRIHLGMLMISQGYLYLSDENNVKNSFYSYQFAEYQNTGIASKQGVYAKSAEENKAE